MSRALVAALLLTLAALSVPLPAVGQSSQAAEPAPVQVADDRSGDIDVSAAGNGLGNPASRYGASDLVSLSVLETRDAFRITLGVGDLAPDGEAPFIESGVYLVAFAHNDQAYQMTIFRQYIQDTTYGGYLDAYDAGRAEYYGVASLAITVDEAANTMSTEVARSLLVDLDGAAPFPGRALTGWQATSETSIMDMGEFCVTTCVPMPGLTVTDHMPDSGVGADVPIVMGLQQTGYAFLESLTPMRASNGEATTFVYEVVATNLDSTAHNFALAISRVPPAWQINVPSALVRLEAGSSATLPVLATTPSGHDHGTVREFLLEMTSLDDAGSVGRIELGVRYLATPQPAGHHNEVHLHTAAPNYDTTLNGPLALVFGFDPNQLYFNTLAPADDDNDAGVPVAGMNAGNVPEPGEPAETTYTWFVPLQPSLQLGLDADLSAVGTARILVDTLLPLPGARLEGRLVHTVPEAECDPQMGPCQFGGIDEFYFGSGNRTTVALLEATSPMEVAANSEGNAFETTIVPQAAADYLQFAPYATLTLQLNLTFGRVDPFFGPHDAPKISGGTLRLPLSEYHDPVDQAFSTMAGLMIEVEGNQSRLVNPGETAVFDLRLMNHLDRAATYDLELSGVGVAWADILGDAQVQLDVGATRPLAVAIVVPDDAVSGAMADLVLTASDATDPTQRTLVRLVAIVDTAADHPDDAGRVKALEDELGSKKSPGPGLGLLLVAVAALALARRR